MPKIVDHEKYKKELLLHCFDVFGRKGFNAVNMRELAAQLSVTTGTLYHYFPNKQALFDELVLFIAERDKSNFISSTIRPDSLEERIKTVVRYIMASETYFLYETFLAVDFFRFKGAEAVAGNQVIQRSSKVYREGLSEFLGIGDMTVIDFVLNSVAGLLLQRVFEGKQPDVAVQANLLSRMVRLYIDSARPGVSDHETKS